MDIEPLSNMEFARIAASISCTASNWTRDILMPYREGPANKDSIERFAKEIRDRLDWLEGK